jgi:hypothetical protein
MLATASVVTYSGSANSLASGPIPFTMGEGFGIPGMTATAAQPAAMFNQPAAATSSAPAGSLTMQPDNIVKIKAGSKTITNRTEKLADGIYTLPDGSQVRLAYQGQAEVEYIGDSVIVTANDTRRTWAADEFAKGEGFQDWADFQKNNKFSKNFVDGNQSRYIYEIKPVAAQFQLAQSNAQILFQEDQSTGYAERTRKNASADATIALATDFTSAGEKLTKSSVEGQKKKYIAVNANTLDVTPERVSKIVAALNSVNAKTLNIAGNGIYTMKGKYTQQQVDDFTYQLLKAVTESPELKTKIESVRTGGQTGFDEAGAKAGIKLGIPTTVLAPKGWKFRDINGTDISSEQQFKARFGQQSSSEVDDVLKKFDQGCKK